MKNQENYLNEIVSYYDNLQEIENKLFEVEKIPLVPSIEEGFFENPRVFGIYKKTGGRVLGVHGSRFEAMQPAEMFKAILATAQKYERFDLSKLTFKEYLGGEIINFDLQLEKIEFKNKAGVDDVTDVIVSFGTSYNGNLSNVINVKSFRYVCSNGLKVYGSDYKLKGKNTINGKIKALAYINEFGKILQNADNYKELLITLDKKEISDEQVKNIIYEVFDFKKSEKKQTRKENILKKVNESMEIEFERTGRTLYGVLNGFTYYSNHLANFNDEKYSKDEYIYFKTGGLINEKAQKVIYKHISLN